MIRRILLVLTGTPSDAKAATAALTLGARLSAHVEALFIRIDPSEILPRIGEGVTGSVVDQLVAVAAKASDEGQARALRTLTDAATKSGTEILPKAANRPGKSAHFFTLQGPSMEMLGMEARLADLVVFGDTSDDEVPDLMSRIEHVLISVRRPVLIARGKVTGKLGDRILAAYDGSNESATALERAVPLLSAAKAVSVVYVKSGSRDPGRTPAALRYLGQHGIEALGFDVKQQKDTIGAEIAQRIKEEGADMIVMGGYGHSRLREMILGGQTRHALFQSSVPVFLAH